MKRRSRRVHGLVLSAAALAIVPAVTNCGKGGLPGMPGGGGDCPSDPSAIAEMNFGLEADAEAKLKAGLMASANLEALAAKIEGDVSMACGNLAKDLGADEASLTPAEEGPGKKAEAACGAAAKLIGEFKAKVSGKLVVEAKEPKCSASMEAVADCAAQCDANVEPGSVEVECEGGELSGSCSGACEGTCTVEAGGSCEGSCNGSCSGSCEAGFSGKCGGTCEGKCDGKDSSGQCAGTCEGKCDAQAEGTCSGTCKGSCSASCEMEAKGECSGSCTGSCDVKMEAPRCTGEVKPPEMSAECSANCDAKASASLECTPPLVQVKFEGAADAEAATTLKAALEKNLPALLNVTIGMKGAVEDAVASVKTSVEGLSGAVSGAGAGALKAAACIKGAVEAQVQASASINVSVQASASASGEATAG